jgi:hypothetical protein
MVPPDGTREDLNVPGVTRIHGRVQAEDNVVKLDREREAPADPTSFEELFLDVHDRLYRALYFVTGSSADAEELMQDAFLKLWERWDRHINVREDRASDAPRHLASSADRDRAH